MSAAQVSVKHNFALTARAVTMVCSVRLAITASRVSASQAQHAAAQKWTALAHLAAVMKIKTNAWQILLTKAKPAMITNTVQIMMSAFQGSAGEAVWTAAA